MKNWWNPLTYCNTKFTAIIDWRLKPEAIAELLSNIRALPGVIELELSENFRVCISTSDEARREELLDEVSRLDGISAISRASDARCA